MLPLRSDYSSCYFLLFGPRCLKVPGVLYSSLDPDVAMFLCSSLHVFVPLNTQFPWKPTDQN